MFLAEKMDRQTDDQLSICQFNWNWISGGGDEDALRPSESYFKEDYQPAIISMRLLTSWLPSFNGKTFTRRDLP